MGLRAGVNLPLDVDSLMCSMLKSILEIFGCYLQIIRKESADIMADQVHPSKLMHYSEV